MPETSAPQPGDWVAVYGQVAIEDRKHPEDTLVTLLSHNEQFVAPVSNRYVRKVDPPPGLSQRCTALWSDDDGDTLHRCKRHLRHGGDHDNGQQGVARFDWPDAHAFGYLEEK